MDTIESYIDQAVDLLQKLEGLPAIALIALLCLAFGYILRFWKKFPNDAIPLAVTLLGATYAGRPSRSSRMAGNWPLTGRRLPFNARVGTIRVR